MPLKGFCKSGLLVLSLSPLVASASPLLEWELRLKLLFLASATYTTKTFYSWLTPAPAPIQLNIILQGSDSEQALKRLAELRKNTPMLAQFLQDIEWTDNSQLIQLVNFFLEHLVPAGFFNEHGDIASHVEGQPVELSHPILAIMQSVMQYPELPITGLYNIAPHLTQFLLDTGNAIHIKQLIPAMLEHAELALFFEEFPEVQNHTPGKKVRGGKVMSTIRSIMCQGDEAVSAVSAHILEEGYYEILQHFLMNSTLSNALSQLDIPQIAIMLSHTEILSFFLSIEESIQLSDKEWGAYILTMIELLDEFGPSVLQKKHQELMLLLIKKRFATDIASQELPSLENAAETIASSVMPGDVGNSGLTLLFLLTNHQNVLAFLNDQTAAFENINASSVMASLNHLSGTHSAVVPGVLQELVNNPQLVLNLPTTTSGLEHILTGGQFSSAERETGETASGAPLAEEVNPDTSSKLVENAPSPPQHAADVIQEGQTLLISAVTNIFPDHPVANVLIAFGDTVGLPPADFDAFLGAAQELLFELGMAEKTDYDRRIFFLHLIPRLAKLRVKPFTLTFGLTTPVVHSPLLQLVEEFLTGFGLPPEHLEQAAAAIIWLIRSFPAAFLITGNVRINSQLASGERVFRLLECYQPEHLPAMLTLLLNNPFILTTAIHVAHQNGNLQNLAAVALELPSCQLAMLPPAHLSLMHVALLSHTLPMPEVVEIKKSAALPLLMDMISTHVLTLWPKSIPLNIRYMVYHLFQLLPGIKNAQSTDEIEEQLKKLFF